MKKTALVLMASVLTLTGCSGSGPSDSVIAECIANANGFEGVGEELESKMMGQVIQTAIINDLTVQNVIERGQNLYIAEAIVELGTRQVGMTDAERERTAEMMGFKLEDGYLMKDAQVSYQFSEGSNGWSCQEI